MKTLQTIQKTFRVFQVLTKVAFILSVVGASLCALGALCTITWYNGGQVFSLIGEPINLYVGEGEINHAMAVMLADMVFLITDAILLAFAGGYFKTEQAEGTPFTENGANIIKKLGIRFIWMPIVAIVIAVVITECLGTDVSGDMSNFPSLVTGIVLILASLIFRYGAELESRTPMLITEGEKDEEKSEE